MENNRKYSPGQLHGFARDSYLERTSRPIYALVFLLPFLFFYEFGTIFINSSRLIQEQRRVVAFVWLQNFAEYIGFSSRFACIATPLLVVIVLLALQITSRTNWRVHIKDVMPMAVECIFLAVPLVALNFILNRPAHPPSESIANYPSGILMRIQALLSAGLTQTHGNHIFQAASTACPTSQSSLSADIITAVGAGIYEELVFRLIVICLLMLLFQNFLGLNRKKSVILSVLIAATLFSAHHHIIFINGQLCRTAAFNWPQFAFRTAAGVYFAALFAVRGFGITAGAHAFYDIIAALINAALITPASH